MRMEIIQHQYFCTIGRTFLGREIVNKKNIKKFKSSHTSCWLGVNIGYPTCNPCCLAMTRGGSNFDVKLLQLAKRSSYNLAKPSGLVH